MEDLSLKALQLSGAVFPPLCCTLCVGDMSSAAGVQTHILLHVCLHYLPLATMAGVCLVLFGGLLQTVHVFYLSASASGFHLFSNWL